MMNFKLSVKDINFIRPLWTYLSFVLITPWYDCNRNCLYKPTINKLTGCIFLAFKLSWIVALILDDTTQQVFEIMPFSQKCLYILTCVNLKIFIFLVVMKSCFWDVDKWRVLITNFRYVDEKLQNTGTKELRVLKNFYCGFAVKEVVFLLFVTYEMYIWSNVLELSFVKGMKLGPMIDLYYEFHFIAFLTCITECLRMRYEELNARLVRMNSSLTIVKDLRSLVQYYRILGEIIDIFNNLFGYQIILLIFHSGLQIISSLNFCFTIITHTDGPLYQHFIIANIYVLFITMFNLFMIVFPMDSTTEESKKFIDLCFKTQEYFIEDCHKIDTLTRLTNFSKHYFREFRPAGFFSIRKAIIFCFIGNVATYVILTFQFNEAIIRLM
ncbi:gustatory receptor 116 [Tribolium castaneum]|uniref:Gustatory receptor n=1 Tax=Tribolium castaneum TaxID=7070 RepID=D6WRQ3_TRICA|nr:PREDICTED: uncharacterized protein LOC107398250 [Tribolium castaneum]EFA07613.1 gustatory receptor 116 [Tribolium castaneum]|eukprot:XP_015837200.1 PREDICTED: uncharacterized protein LOC107398250 [Tribolium castaneum]